MIAAATPIDRIGLSVRCATVLKAAGLVTVGEVCGRSARDLAALPDFSPACLEELMDRLLDTAAEGANVVRFVPAGVLRAKLHRRALELAGERDRLLSDLDQVDGEIAANARARARLAERGA